MLPFSLLHVVNVGLGLFESDGSGDDVELLGLLVGHPDDCGLPECVEGCDTVVDLGLGVTAGESPGVVDTGEGEQALGDVSDCQSDTAGCGAEVDGDGSGASDYLERQRVDRATTALPGTAAPLDLDDVELCVVDSFLDGRSDFLTLCTAYTDESVSVSTLSTV